MFKISAETYAKNCVYNMKDVAKIGVAKVKTVLVDLSKLSNVVDNNVVKKTVYKKLVTKVNSIGFVLKTKYDTGNLEKT